MASLVTRETPSRATKERIDYLFDRGKSEDLRALVCGTKKMTVTVPNVTCALRLRREYGKRIEMKGIRSPQRQQSIQCCSHFVAVLGLLHAEDFQGRFFKLYITCLWSLFPPMVYAYLYVITHMRAANIRASVMDKPQKLL